MHQPFLQPGRAYSFGYPRHNYRQIPTTTEQRRIVVVSVRDTRDDPLDHVTETLNPLLKRSRWLVTGMDLDKDLERSFYVESMSNIQALSEDDLQPLKGVEYVVVAQHHVAFKTLRLHDALAFRSQRRAGAVCAVLCNFPLQFSLDTVDDLFDEDNEDLNSDA